MGLQLTPNTTNIFIHGTDIELTSVYARLTFTAHPDGVTISASFKTYLDHAKFLLGDEIFTSIHSLNFDFVILETEDQSLQTALDYSILKFNDYGYNAIIV